MMSRQLAVGWRCEAAVTDRQRDRTGPGVDL